MYRDPVPKNSWVFLTGGGGARTPMQKCLWTYHRIVRIRKDILQMSQFWFTCTWLLSRCGIFFGRDHFQNTLLEPTNVGNQFLFWKCSPIFLFLIWPNLGPFFFLGPSGLFLGLGSGSKLFWGLDNQLWFWKYSPIFMFLIWPHLEYFFNFFNPLGLFWAFWGYFFGLSQFRKHFVDYQFWFHKNSPILLF